MNTDSSGQVSDPKRPVPTQWRWHWRTLLRLRARLLGQEHAHLAAARTLQKADDPDFAALASEESEFKALIAEVNSEEGLLAEVDAALGRLQRGIYGFCEATHQPISPERLRAVPWTRFSREAAAARER